MVDSSRRAFMVGAGFAASATYMFPGGTRAQGSNSSSKASTYLQPLIDRERQNILATMAKDDIPGASVCFISEGKPVWIEAFGVTDERSKRRIDDSTIFNIESTSKNFTATAIMIAVQRGILDLDQPITAYLPDFTVQSRFEPLPEQKITLRLLLSHRAGFTHEAPIGNNFDPTFSDFETHVRSISRTWLRYPVADRYAYSNLGFDLAGYILQTAVKMPFADCLKTMIFDPLGMSDSTASTDVYSRRVDRAIGHEKGYTTVPLKIPLIPSGGVYTSARDMAVYAKFHLNQGKINGKTVLEEKFWKEMHSFSFGGNYSLGIVRAELRYGDTPIRELNHNGGGFGFGCSYTLYPEAGIAWVALFNRPTDAGYQMGAGLQQQALAHRYGEQKARLPVQDLSAIELPEQELEKFVGNWRGRAFAGDIKIANGVLGIQGPVFVPLTFTSPTDMFFPLPQPHGEAFTLHYLPERAGLTASLLAWVGDGNFDYNDGPRDPVGENKAEWESYLGEYVIEQWGRPQSQHVKIHRKNGYLYLDETRLIVEVEPGLFFASDGEAVDFRHSVPTWKNIALHRAVPSSIPSPRSAPLPPA